MLLENVPGLLTIDDGRTVATVLSELRGAGYCVEYRCINSVLLVPQNRSRVYFVCVRKDVAGRLARQAPPQPTSNEDECASHSGSFQFQWPDIPDLGRCVRDILEPGESL